MTGGDANDKTEDERGLALLLCLALCIGMAAFPTSAAEEAEAGCCLTFSASSNFTLRVYDGSPHWTNLLEYSTDANTWAAWDGSTISSAYGRLYLRGTGNSVITGNYSADYRWVLTGSNISCTGNIETLLDYKTVQRGDHPEMGQRCFQNLFRQCTALVEAPELLSETVSYCGYDAMFYGCTSLVKAPELPAMTLGYYSYDFMFEGCTSLISVPETLPAAAVTNYCYYKMFKDCTSLKAAPALPATDLTNAQYCYSGMFSGCTSLVTAPALPATKLARNCYDSMFEGCTSLVSVPALPAPTVSGCMYCYSSMFRGCTSLKTAPVLPADSPANYCHQSMFNGCVSLTRPALMYPFYSLYDGSCSFMYSGCTSLTTIPEFPTNYLSSSCYSYMFSGCNALMMSDTATEEYLYEVRIPKSGSASTGGASSICTGMFQNCGGTFTGYDKKGTPSLSKTYYTTQPLAAYNRYTLSFDANGHGIAPEYQSFAGSGCYAEEPQAPAADGYVFQGWYKDYACTQKWNFNTDTVTAYTVLYAKWKPPYVKVSFDMNGHGSAPASQNVIPGNLAENPGVPTAEGYTFTGWYKEANCTNVWNFASDTVNEDMILYAGWIVSNVTVTFHNGSTLLGTQTFTPGEAQNLSTAYQGSVSGYGFYGWAISDSMAIRAYTGGQSASFAADTDLYAVYSREITFYSGTAGGTKNTVTQYYFGGSAQPVAAPAITRPNNSWTPHGWWTGTTAALSRDAAEDALFTPTAASYYATFSRTVAVAYNGNGSTSGSTADTQVTQVYNSAGNLSPSAAALAVSGFNKTGYAFSNWNTSADGTGTSYTPGDSYNLPGVDDTATTLPLYAVWGRIFDVTVPVSLPVTVDGGGTVSVSSGAEIRNNGIGAVRVTEARVTACNGWTLAAYTDDFGAKPVDSKQFGLQINGVDARTGGIAETFAAISAGSSAAVLYGAKVAPLSEDVSDTMAELVFILQWDS